MTVGLASEDIVGTRWMELRGQGILDSKSGLGLSVSTEAVAGRAGEEARE